MIEAAFQVLAASALQMPDPPSAPATETVRSNGAVEPAAPSDAVAKKPASRWFVRVGALRALYNSSARFTVRGQAIEGGSALVTDGTTPIVEVGYDLNGDVALMLTGGFPPKADVLGEGTISPYGKLASVRFGTAVLTGIYRLPGWHGVRPYVGAGAAHIFILKTHDAAVKGLKAHDHNGVVLQAGVEIRVNRRWELFADYKRLWLNIRAEGELGGAPFRARVVLNPDVVSTGLKFHF